MEPLGSASDKSEFLAGVEARLTSLMGAPISETTDSHDSLMEAARHLCVGGGGKRARPVLVSLFADVLGLPDVEVISIAVAAELIHSASLLHDDVIDAGMYRRGKPTANAMWGNIVAVMSGDLVLTLALQELSDLNFATTKDAISTVAQMTRGSILEVEGRGNVALPLSAARNIGEWKTGSLFAFCGSAVGRLAKNEEAGNHFAQFGRRLGVAFQIADDVRDLMPPTHGKPRFADIYSGTPSVPLLLAAGMDEGFRKRIKEAWSFGVMRPELVNELGMMVLRTGAVEQSLTLMQQEIEDAIKALGDFARLKGGDALVESVRNLAQGIHMEASNERLPVDNRPVPVTAAG